MMENFHMLNQDSNLTHVCSFGLMKGKLLQITSNQRNELTNWRLEAVNIEKKIALTKKEQMVKLLEKVAAVEQQSQKTHTEMQNNKYDMNHNSLVEESFQTSRDILPLSLESVDFKLLAPKTIKLSSSENAVHQGSNSGRESLDIIHTTINKKKIIITSSTESQNDAISDISLVPEVVEQMKSLQMLLEKQKELDVWHENMQRQLQLEQIRLKEKYNEMRLTNIKEQHKLVENSREYLANASLCYSASLQTTSSPHCYQNISMLANSSKKLKISESVLEQSELLIENQSINKAGYNNKFFEPVNSPSSLKVKRLLPTPPPFDGKNIYLEDNSLLNSISNNINGMESSNDFVVQTLNPDHDSTDNHKSDNSDTNPLNPDIKISSTTSTLFQSSNDNMSRRKSRPIRFFQTPEKHLVEKEKSNDKSCFGSTSTPQESWASTVKHANQNLSPVRKDFTPQPFQDSVQFASKRFDKVVAVSKGFLTRRLMKTSKVTEIVKTIKDTAAFLEGMNKENKPVNHADKQMINRLHDELSIKRQKLHDIFFNMDPTEQMKLLSISRMQAREKMFSQSKSYTKREAWTTNVSKKLSTASQRTLQRKLQYDKKNDTTPVKLLGPHNTNVNANQSSKSQFHESKVLNTDRSFKPIQSRCSPVLVRPKTSDSTSKELKKKVNTKLNIISVSKTYSKKRDNTQFEKGYPTAV